MGVQQGSFPESPVGEILLEQSPGETPCLLKLSFPGPSAQQLWSRAFAGRGLLWEPFPLPRPGLCEGNLVPGAADQARTKLSKRSNELSTGSGLGRPYGGKNRLQRPNGEEGHRGST